MAVSHDEYLRYDLKRLLRFGTAEPRDTLARLSDRLGFVVPGTGDRAHNLHFMSANRWDTLRADPFPSPETRVTVRR